MAPQRRAPVARTPEEREQDEIFEEEVRSFARLLYPGNEARGSIMLDGRERDLVFVTDDVVVYIEVTRSRTQAKAQKDVEKLLQGYKLLSNMYPTRAIRTLFITQEPPLPHQRKVVDATDGRVKAMSFETFRTSLFDARGYIRSRQDYAFGSAQDPVTGKSRIEGDYIDLDLIETATGNSYSAAKVRELLLAGRTVVITGDYGAGKSMTLREVFAQLAGEFLAHRSAQSALYLNLRDHHGQSEPTEALHRHAQLVPFEHPSQLVRAWRSGITHLILDGFDEIPGVDWPGRRIESFREEKRESVTLVRRFLEGSPKGVGVLLAGRGQYFESENEMRRALDLPGDALILSASDFTESQVNQYLISRDWSTAVPEWLPKRPLLVGHIAARNALQEISDDGGGLSEELGWDYLIDVLCRRDARVSAQVDGYVVRAILERLAVKAADTGDGLGPLDFSEIVSAFEAVSSRSPSAATYLLLGRLPGMRANSSAENARSFVDPQLTEALRAGGIASLMRDAMQKGVEQSGRWETCVGELGLRVEVVILERLGISDKALQDVLRGCLRVESQNALALEIVRVLLANGRSVDSEGTFESYIVPVLEMGEGASGKNLLFSQCLIGVLDVTANPDADSLPSFSHSSIDVVLGASALDELAKDKFPDSSISRFDETSANSSAILSLPVSDYARVVLTLLQKLFVQHGSRRKESALHRGAFTQSQRELVPQALEDLKRENVAYPVRFRGTVMWQPRKGAAGRVREILKNPLASRDVLIREARGRR